MLRHRRTGQDRSRWTAGLGMPTRQTGEAGVARPGRPKIAGGQLLARRRKKKSPDSWPANLMGAYSGT